MLRFPPKLFLSPKSRVKIEERIFVGEIIGKMFAYRSTFPDMGSVLYFFEWLSAMNMIVETEIQFTMIIGIVGNVFPTIH